MSKQMKIGIVGSRDFGDLSRVSQFVRTAHDFYGPDLIIVSGGAVGVDTIAEREAKDLGIPTVIFHPTPPNASRRAFIEAAFARNTLIVEASDIVFAFWTFDSAGTLDTIRKAKNLGKLGGIITPKKAFIDTDLSTPFNEA